MCTTGYAGADRLCRSHDHHWNTEGIPLDGSCKLTRSPGARQVGCAEAMLREFPASFFGDTLNEMCSRK